jgi:hypothetical protein
MKRLLASLFLVLHGITHAFVLTDRTPLASALLGLTIGICVLAGVAVACRATWWASAVYAAAAVSAIELLATWNSSSLWGLPIDAAIVACVFFVTRRRALDPQPAS